MQHIQIKLTHKFLQENTNFYLFVKICEIISIKKTSLSLVPLNSERPPPSPCYATVSWILRNLHWLTDDGIQHATETTMKLQLVESCNA